MLITDALRPGVGRWGIDTTGLSTQAWEALPTDGRGGGEGSMLLRSINIKDVINRFAQDTCV